jgi:hypothetical protein
MTARKRLNIQLKEEYKKILEKKAAEMTIELEERVTITKILYTLIDHHLSDACNHIREKV